MIKQFITHIKKNYFHKVHHALVIDLEYILILCNNKLLSQPLLQH